MNYKLKYLFLNILINFNTKCQNNFLNFEEINVFKFQEINFQEIFAKNLDQNYLYLFLKESLQDFNEKMIFLKDLIINLTNLNLNIEFITLIRINIFLLQKEILKTLILLNEKNQFQKVKLEYVDFNVIFMSFEFKFMNLYMSINKYINIFEQKIIEITNMNTLVKQIEKLNINQEEINEQEKEIDKLKEDLFNFNIKYCSLKEQINSLKMNNRNYLNIKENIISLKKQILTKQKKLLEIEKENQFQKENNLDFFMLYKNIIILKNKLEQKKKEKREIKIKKKIKKI